MKYKAAPQPGTVADLVTRYRRSPRVLAWAPSTRLQCDKTLGDFMAANPRVMVRDIRRGDLIAARDDLAEIPGAANNWLRVIAGLFDYAVDIEMIEFSPARGIRRLKPKAPGGHRTWREDEIEAYEAHWPRGTLQRRAFTLALYTGAAAADLVRLGWINIQSDRCTYVRQKTGNKVDVPTLPALAEELALVPRSQMTFLEMNGHPMRADYVRQFLRRAVNAAGLGAPDRHGRHLTPHGLRKALGRRLAEAGVDVHGIMAILGHESIRSAEVYTKAYDRARAADIGMEKLAGAPASNVTRMKREPRA